MNTITKITAIGLAMILFTWVNAQIADSVGQYQLEAAFVCNYTAATCRGRHPNRIIIRSTT